LLMLLSVGAAGIGYYMAGRAYTKADKGFAEPIAAASPPVYNALLNKYYVDEGYDYVFTGRRKVGDVRLGTMGLGEASSWFDANIVDGAVNGAGRITGVNLRAAWITDTDLGRLAGLPQLARLNLSLTHISDLGMERLAP